MNGLDHTLERTVLIRARRDTVFRYFTDSARFAAWWGAGSTIDGAAGRRGAHPLPERRHRVGGGARPSAPRKRWSSRTATTIPASPSPAGDRGSRSRWRSMREGTLLRLRHDLADAATRDAHVPGWRFQLALFANVAAREEHAGAAAAIDRFFALWSEPDPARRLAELASIATPDVSFRDAWACTSGIEDLGAHIGAVQVHAAGAALVRDGRGPGLPGHGARGLGDAARRRRPGRARHERLRPRPRRPHRAGGRDRLGPPQRARSAVRASARPRKYRAHPATAGARWGTLR